MVYGFPKKALGGYKNKTLTLLFLFRKSEMANESRSYFRAFEQGQLQTPKNSHPKPGHPRFQERKHWAWPETPAAGMSQQEEEKKAQGNLLKGNPGECEDFQLQGLLVIS